MQTTTDNLARAKEAHAKGIAAIPCHPGTKTPCVKWKRFQTTLPSEELLERWFAGADNNIAIITTGMVLFDCETFAAAEIVLKHCGLTPYVVRTPGGGLHLGYAKPPNLDVTNRVRLLAKPIDIRTDGGLAMIPPSATDEGLYLWLSEGLPAISDLPIANVDWIGLRPRPQVRVLTQIDSDDVMIRRARGYLSCVEGAISGQRGHDRTMRAACILVQKFGLSIPQAWPLFLEWNEQCEPPWSERELLHKLQDAERLKHQWAKGVLPCG